jgi:quercetin dioxygenase-like cupin family protein
MDQFQTVTADDEVSVPAPLRGLFNRPDDVHVQPLPCELQQYASMVVHFGAGARTVPHVHHNGQHLFVTAGVGVVADERGVHVVRAGEVISNPPGTWHWHGATPTTDMTHVTVEAPGDFDLKVDRRDWDDVYRDDLGR